jgi:alkylated DNA repair protein (DNA oxidative demethylase)
MQMDGLKIFPEFLDREAQIALVADLRKLVRRCPFYTPVMPGNGKPMSVRMTNLGDIGWVADRSGYRYQQNHPQTGNRWPAIPEQLINLWRELSDYPHLPEACLVNHYTGNARMGLHQDADEHDFNAPVISISLGDSAVFRIGGTSRRDRTRSFRLHSGDVLVMGSTARMRFHGIDRIVAGSSALLSGGGRLNLTLRRVNLPTS